MNSRIKELLEQAGVGDNWNKADWYSMSPKMIEKFAELIVRECMQVANEYQNRGGNCYVDDMIAEHFGV